MYKSVVDSDDIVKLLEEMSVGSNELSKKIHERFIFCTKTIQKNNFSSYVCDYIIYDESKKINHNMDLLASVASLAPFVGLLCTVWGVILSFQNIATFDIVQIAPSISEALFATAVGLFVAIPSNIFYNRLSKIINENEDLLDLIFVNVSAKIKQIS